FTEEEIVTARAAGFVPVGLGERILRTETAGPVICALIMQRAGQFR
ncbi:MAG: 16S rRNA (uracil(1498)-N(3))-methyltransferase, partial [candidate division Zixibacteria bacterium]